MRDTVPLHRRILFWQIRRWKHVFSLWIFLFLHSLQLLCCNTELRCSVSSEWIRKINLWTRSETMGLTKKFKHATLRFAGISTSKLLLLSSDRTFGVCSIGVSSIETVMQYAKLQIQARIACIWSLYRSESFNVRVRAIARGFVHAPRSTVNSTGGFRTCAMDWEKLSSYLAIVAKPLIFVATRAYIYIALPDYVLLLFFSLQNRLWCVRLCRVWTIYTFTIVVDQNHGTLAFIFIFGIVCSPSGGRMKQHSWNPSRRTVLVKKFPCSIRHDIVKILRWTINGAVLNEKKKKKNYCCFNCSFHSARI